MPTTRSRSGESNAIDMLMEDHKKVQKLFRDFEKLGHEDTEACRELVTQACTELKVHSMLEKEIFYPAVRDQADKEELEDALNEAEVEHGSVDELIEKLEGMDASDPMYSAHFTVVAEYVKHHIREEEKEMFPAVKKIKSLDLDALGQEIQQRKAELMAEFGGESTQDDKEAEQLGEEEEEGEEAAHRRR
ncbi:MAG TPA: hemerythrin domain-containing protein [Burkholderiales bacterium]|nr:hemerythrin domain-containing protein [Burkholderiales bacterium]